VTVQNRIFFTYLYLDNATGMTHLKIKKLSGVWYTLWLLWRLNIIWLIKSRRMKGMGL